MGIYVTDYMILFIGLLSIFDLHCTLKWIGINPYMEFNPVMRWLWLANPSLFVLLKIAVTLGFCLVACKFKDNLLLRRLIWLPFCLYVLITAMHCS